MKYLILIGVLIALLGLGGQGLYTYLCNPSAVEVACDQYLKERPDGLWLRLQGCQLNLARALYEYYQGSEGKPNRLFIPVLPADAPDDARTGLVVETRDPKMVATYQEMMGLDKNPGFTEADAEKWVLEHADEVFPKRDLEGVIRFGLELEDTDRKQIAGLASELTPDFVILEEGARPQPWLSLGFFAAGLAVLGFTIRKIVRAVRGPTPAPAAPAAGGADHGEGPAKPLGPS